ncbi:hypothetical protein CKO51_21045 [Rhodopirellula sp. SM50]|nr:hypothetical protein [Rhodopirellula sp. SM50]PAY17551.1 hypothetical protein CKO51_21045 [Rhodopirellula sp. SM50]
MPRSILLILVLGFTSLVVADARAASPTGWSPVIIATGEYRERIKSMPIHQRPGRPLHVYGNTVRLIKTSRVSAEPVRPMRQIFFGSPTLIGPRR